LERVSDRASDSLSLSPTTDRKFITGVNPAAG
jgi:hypothetical protein